MKSIYHKGFWNGESALFRIFQGVVGPEPEWQTRQIEKISPGLKRYLWFVPFIGTERQMVEVLADGEVFYLDNEDGTGLYKVTKGGGCFTCAHASVYPSAIKRYLLESEWNVYTPTLQAQVRENIEEAWMKLDPEGFTEYMERMKKVFDYT